MLALIEIVAEFAGTVVTSLVDIPFAQDTSGREALLFFGLTGVMLVAAVVLINWPMALCSLVLPWLVLWQVRRTRRAHAGDPHFQRQQNLFYLGLALLAAGLTVLFVCNSLIASLWPAAVVWLPVHGDMPHDMVTEGLEIAVAPAAILLFWIARNGAMAMGFGLVAAAGLVSGFDALVFRQTLSSLHFPHATLPSLTATALVAGTGLLLIGFALPRPMPEPRRP